jgi:hypothetical protein
MDMNQSKVPVDETSYNRDIKQESQEKIVSKAEDNVKKVITRSWESSLPKAREALRLKREQSKLKNQDAAKGTTAPDLLVEVSNLLEKKFAPFLVQLESLKTMRSHEGPLQAQGKVEETKVEMIETPSFPNDVIPIHSHDEPNYPVIPQLAETEESKPIAMKRYYTNNQPDHTSKKARMEQQESYVRKFKKASEHFDFNTLEVSDRARQDPATNGTPYERKANVILW